MIKSSINLGDFFVFMYYYLGKGYFKQMRGIYNEITKKIIITRISYNNANS